MSARGPVASGGTLEEAFARECRRLRAAAGWRQEDLAGKARASQATVSYAETGIRISPQSRAAIAAALGTTTGAMAPGAVPGAAGGAPVRSSLECRERARWLASVRAGDVRRECGIRQATVAEALGVGRAAVSQWENGMKGPSGKAGAAYCRVVAGLLRHLEVREEGPPEPEGLPAEVAAHA